MGVSETLTLLTGLALAGASVTAAALAVLHPDHAVRVRAREVLELLFGGRRPKGR